MKPEVDLDALLAALILAPGTFSRNRFFWLFERPEAARIRRRAARIRSILRQLASESQPVGANHEPGVAPIPTELSRAGAIDARPTVVAGRSPCERAIVALRAARGAGFTRLPWEDQCAIAAAEIRAGRVVAS